jgi:hypothetical protein
MPTGAVAVTGVYLYITILQRSLLLPSVPQDKMKIVNLSRLDRCV